jgi:hypothetical protein
LRWWRDLLGRGDGGNDRAWRATAAVTGGQERDTAAYEHYRALYPALRERCRALATGQA